jgi:hypothetical protein
MSASSEERLGGDCVVSKTLTSAKRGSNEKQEGQAEHEHEPAHRVRNQSCYYIFESACWSKEELSTDIGSNVCGIKLFVDRLRGACYFRMVRRFSDALGDFTGGLATF